jgi:hypothetical protein
MLIDDQIGVLGSVNDYNARKNVVRKNKGDGEEKINEKFRNWGGIRVY